MEATLWRYLCPRFPVIRPHNHSGIFGGMLGIFAPGIHSKILRLGCGGGVLLVRRQVSDLGLIVGGFRSSHPILPEMD